MLLLECRLRRCVSLGRCLGRGGVGPCLLRKLGFRLALECRDRICMRLVCRLCVAEQGLVVLFLEGGQRLRVSFARCLLIASDLRLRFGEPSISLALEGRESFLVSCSGRFGVPQQLL